MLVKQIDPSPFQTRSDFPEEEIRELAESIRRDGLLQAPIVRERVVARSGRRQTRYELVAGERRFRACQLLIGKIGELPVIVSEKGHLCVVLRRLLETHGYEWRNYSRQSRRA